MIIMIIILKLVLHEKNKKIVFQFLKYYHLLVISYLRGISRIFYILRWLKNTTFLLN